MVNVNIPTPIMLNHNFLVIVILFSLPLLKTSLARAVLDSFRDEPVSTHDDGCAMDARAFVAVRR